MRRFFRSKKFIIILAVTVVLIVSSVTVAFTDSKSAIQTGIVGSVIKPIQSGFNSATQAVGDFFGVFKQRDELEKENAELNEKLNALVQEKLEWEEALTENKFYEDFLELKENNEDFAFCSARVIARDSADVFSTLTIDCGSLDGVSVHDPVITADGLVGYVEQVAPTYSTVATILNPSVNVGAYDRRTDDSGIVSGGVSEAAKGLCVMSGLNRYSTVSHGDYIVTAGGTGVFPAGLIVGTIDSISRDDGNLSLTATIKPTADILNCRNVMVITSFTGQNSLDEILK